jgi:PilZ domain
MSERRRFERVPFFTNVTALLPGGTSVEARSVDISLRGAGLVSPAPLPARQTVYLTFQVKTPTGLVPQGPVVGRVIRVRFEHGATVAGVEFAQPLDRGVVPALVKAIERL